MRRVRSVPLSRPYCEWDDGTEEVGEFFAEVGELRTARKQPCQE